MKLSDCQPEERALDLTMAETSQPIASAASVPMKGIWDTIRGYILWSYERGTIQYDVMVTLILLFIFLSPIWINFNDKPVSSDPHQTGVVQVAPDGRGGFIYQIEAQALSGNSDELLRSEMLSVIEPISGAVTITKYEKISSPDGKTQSYRVWANRN